MFARSIHDPHWRPIWKSWETLRVKVFLWLAALDRCWTADRPARHGPQHHTACPLCDQAPEMMQHLLLACPFSRQVWHEVLGWARMAVDLPSADTPFQTWWTSCSDRSPAPVRKGLSSLIILTAWWLWKHRNSRVFDGATPSLTLIIDTIKDEARLWAKAGATGQQNFIPGA